MSLNPKLHAILIARQSEAELKRKREKAWRKDTWTMEDIDYAKRSALVMSCKLFGVLKKD